MSRQTQSETSSLIARWRRKFACAFRGLAIGVRGESSFLVHIPVGVAVVAVATWLGVTPIEWAVLIVCIAMVISAELFNSAIEHLAKAVTAEDSPEIRNALDIASGAVLFASLGASLVGLKILAWPLVMWLTDIP